MEKTLLLSADKWEFTDEKTGEVKHGVTLTYINAYRDQDESSLGYKPTSLSAGVEVWPELQGKNLPALCEMGFGSKPGTKSNPKPTVYISTLRYVSAVDVFGKQVQPVKAAA